MNRLRIRQERADGNGRAVRGVHAMGAEDGERIAVATADDRLDIERGHGRWLRRG
jgi:hypothetical protein